MIKILPTKEEDDAERQAKAMTSEELNKAFEKCVMRAGVGTVWFHAVYNELRARGEIPSKKKTPKERDEYVRRLVAEYPDERRKK